MIPLIFKLIDTDDSCHLHDKQSDLYYWSHRPCRVELELPCVFPIRLLAYPASCHTWLPKNVQFQESYRGEKSPSTSSPNVIILVPPAWGTGPCGSPKPPNGEPDPAACSLLAGLPVLAHRTQENEEEPWKEDEDTNPSPHRSFGEVCSGTLPPACSVNSSLTCIRALFPSCGVNVSGMGSLGFAPKIKLKEGRHAWPVVLVGIPCDTFKISSVPL